MTKHILVAGKLHPSALRVLDSAEGVSFDYVPDADPTAYLPLLPKAQGLVLRTQTLNAAHIATAPDLQIVSRHGVGYDAVDVPALTKRGIPLAIVGDVNSRTVAEHAMLLLLAASRCLVKSVTGFRAGDWAQRNMFEPRELYGKTLLIVGYGRIGRHLAQMAKAFGVHVLAYDPYLGADHFAGAEQVADISTGLKRADLVSLHIPKADGPILGAAELALLPAHAVVVNTARGGLIDEPALAQALKEGRLGAAGLDVLEVEPPFYDHPLFGLDNAIITPHAAGLTEECAERMGMVSVQNVLDYFAETLNPDLVVNGPF